MTRTWQVLGTIVLGFGCGPAAAFTFADGTTAECVARGEVVAEVTLAGDDPAIRNRTGLASRVDGRWQITWNGPRLKSLPSEVHDFIFFHECAHVRVPTEVELEANCAGLIDMRAAGRAGPDFEARLRAKFPRQEPYWDTTFRCADVYAERERAKPSAAPN